jgi:hypothetical protein
MLHWIISPVSAVIMEVDPNALTGNDARERRSL